MSLNLTTIPQFVCNFWLMHTHRLAKEGKIGTKSLSALTMYRDFLLEFKNMQSDARKQEQRDAIAEERLAW